MRDESKYGICDLCGEPQKWLHDIGTEIRCGEVTTTGKYVDPDLVAVYLSREDAEDWARSRWMSGSVGERSVAAARAALEANPTRCSVDCCLDADHSGPHMGDDGGEW